MASFECLLCKMMAATCAVKLLHSTKLRNKSKELSFWCDRTCWFRDNVVKYFSSAFFNVHVRLVACKQWWITCDSNVPRKKKEFQFASNWKLIAAPAITRKSFPLLFIINQMRNNFVFDWCVSTSSWNQIFFFCQHFIRWS